MKFDEDPHFEIFCADAGHLRQGEVTPRRVVIARFEISDYGDGVIQWQEINARSARQQALVDALPEPLENRLASQEFGLPVRSWPIVGAPACDRPSPRTQGSRGWQSPVNMIGGDGVDIGPDRAIPTRYRFHCRLCRMTVVAVDQDRFQQVLKTLFAAGVADVSLRALAARLSKRK